MPRRTRAGRSTACTMRAALILGEGQPRTAERLDRRGVEVVEVVYGEIQRGGGGIHCTTMELRRERA